MSEGENTGVSRRGAAAGVAEQAAGSPRDVFVSYASRDAGVAESVCQGLEDAGITCWIAPRDVAPGALYADAIVRAITGAKALVLLLSESALLSPHVGKEIERASSKQRPIIALRIDTAPLTPALEYFLSESQWIEAPGGRIDAALPKLRDALHRLLKSATQAPGESRVQRADDSINEPLNQALGSQSKASRSQSRASRVPRMLIALAALVGVALAAIIAARLWFPPHGSDVSSPPVTPIPPSTVAASFSPPPHSVAVLPFVNMSGDREQDYFSDGLSEELLNSLVTVRDLRVAARTSSFSFKGSNADTAEIARKLNVGAILEGSVRKDGIHVRVTAQLINAVTGFHLWSKTYDRDLKDVLKLQTELATEVTTALQATLMGDVATQADLGGTQNPQAFDAFLRGEKVRRLGPDKDRDLARIAAYSEAIKLDPQFAKAYAAKAGAFTDLANYLSPAAAQDSLAQAQAMAEQAVKLAPEFGEAHAALAAGLALRFDFAGAAAEFERALALAPGSAVVLRASAGFLSGIGRAEAALANARRATGLDPLNPIMHRTLGIVLTEARRYDEAIAEFNQAMSVNTGDSSLAVQRGFARLAQGQFDAAREDCATPPLDWANRTCLAIAYAKVHRMPEAQAALDELTAATGDTASYQYAEIYTQWGNLPKALDWLDTAYKIKDPGLSSIKVDPLLDPLRGESRFQQVLAKLKFPE